jgi:hypothetical protein
VKKPVCSSFDIVMVQPRFVGAERQSATARRAVSVYAARSAQHHFVGAEK